MRLLRTIFKCRTVFTAKIVTLSVLLTSNHEPFCQSFLCSKGSLIPDDIPDLIKLNITTLFNGSHLPFESVR